MDPKLVMICLLSLTNATPSGYIGWPHDGAGSLWHVFRQVHASEVGSRQLLSSSRTPSSKVAETTRIIPKEEPRSQSSFTIISRIKSPFEQMLNLIPPRPSWASGFSGRRAEHDEESSRRTSSIIHGAWPSRNASNFLIIGEAEPVVDDRRQVETSRHNDGLYTVEKGLVRYRGSQSNRTAETDNETDGNEPDRDHSHPTFGLWEMLKVRRPQKWDVLNKLLTQPTTEMPTSTSSLNWNESSSAFSFRLENDDSSVLVTEINSLALELTIPPATTASSQLPDMTTASTDWNGSQSRDSGWVHSTQPATPHQLEGSWLVVRIDDSTLYAVTATFANNGTLIFQRLETAGLDGLNQSSWQDLSHVEAYYPGFSQVAKNKPNRIVIQSTVIALTGETLNVMNDVEREGGSQAIKTPQSVVMGNQTVLIPSTSPWAGNEPAVFAVIKANGTDEIIPILPVDSYNSSFRKVDNNKMSENDVQPLSDVNSTIPSVLPFVTPMPNNSAEEQMAPPLLKTLENLLLTHLLPPITSSSSISSVSSSLPSSSTTSTSSPSSLLHHSNGEVTVSNWTEVSQPVESVMMSSNSMPSSTTPPPEANMKSPAHYDPTINESTLSSHSVIIPMRSSSPKLQLVSSYPAMHPELIGNPELFTKDQLSLMAVSEKPPISTTPTTLATISPAPIQMFTLRPVVESIVDSVVTKAPPKKSPGIASLILSHTAALLTGKKNPPLGSNNNRPESTTNSTEILFNTSQTLAPILKSVHVIVATPISDPEQEEELRYRSVDYSGVKNRKEQSVTANNSSWAFPSFNQLIESPDLFRAGPSTVQRPVNTKPVSSLNDNRTADELPPLPRFTCGQQTTADELVLTNPSYPDPDEHPGRCGFRLLVISKHVCQVRVEFRDSRMLLPRRGFCLDQHLTVYESTANNSSVVENKFCGWNSDQHFYVVLSEQAGTTPRHVDFQINTIAAGFPYRYSLVVQQIDCQIPSPAKAPTGCFQYFPDSQTGVIKSFNFDGGQYWNNQRYRICIRSIDQSCTLALSSIDGQFGLHKASSRQYPADRAGVGIRACPRDFLWIPGSIQSELTTKSSITQDRFCGSKLSDRQGDTASRVVTARMYSRIHIIEFHAGFPRFYDARYHGPGFRIQFEQINNCPSLPTKVNDDESLSTEINRDDDATEPALSINQEDYYDEALEQGDDLAGRLQRLRSNEEDIVTLFKLM